jgi:hypothetical protein
MKATVVGPYNISFNSSNPALLDSLLADARCRKAKNVKLPFVGRQVSHKGLISAAVYMIGFNVSLPHSAAVELVKANGFSTQGILHVLSLAAKVQREFDLAGWGTPQVFPNHDSAVGVIRQNHQRVLVGFKLSGEQSEFVWQPQMWFVVTREL